MLDGRVMIHIPCDRHHHPLRRVMPIHEIDQLISPKARHRAARPDDGPCQCVASIDDVFESIEYEIFRRVLVHLHLLEHDVLLLLELLLGEVGFKHEIKNRVDRPLEMLIECAGEVACVLFGGEGVEIAPHRF